MLEIKENSSYVGNNRERIKRKENIIPLATV